MVEPYYRDDLITLYHGDCLEIKEWLAADVMVTDPPYGIGWSIGDNPRAHSWKHEGIPNDSDTSRRDQVLSWWAPRPGAVFGTWRRQIGNPKQVLVWRKPVDAGVVGSTTGFRTDTELIFLIGDWPVRSCDASSVVESNSNKNAYLRPGLGHPHAKPVSLMERIIEKCPPGMIADPFAGSGSTLLACVNQKRKAIGVELEEKYCEIIAKRLSNQTASLF